MDDASLIVNIDNFVVAQEIEGDTSTNEFEELCGKVGM
jgi:hypothetical protein